MIGIIPWMALEVCAAALAAGPAAIEGPAPPEKIAPGPAFVPLLPPRVEPAPLFADFPTQQPGQAKKPEPEPQKPAEPKPGEQQPADAQKPAPPPPHRFFDKKNNWLFAGAFVARSLDFASTLNMRARGRDEILLTNDIVDNEPAFAFVEIGGVALNVGLAYWLHRKNHHKLERWLSSIHIGVTTFGAARNYMLETRRTLPAPP
jgi:hypothetical protein